MAAAERDDFDDFLLQYRMGGSLRSRPRPRPPTMKENEEERKGKRQEKKEAEHKKPERVVLSCGNRKWYMDSKFTERLDDADYEPPEDKSGDSNSSEENGAASFSDTEAPYANRRTFNRHSMYEFSSKAGRKKTQQQQQQQPVKEEGKQHSRLAERRGKPVTPLACAVLQEEDWSVSPKGRPRVASMPSRTRPARFSRESLKAKGGEQEEEEGGGITRVRSFRITRKGLVKEDPDQKTQPKKKTSSTKKKKKVVVEKVTYRVMVMGASGVGKKALIREFMIPDTHPFASVSFDDDGDKSVSILLDGEESTMEFVDLSDQEVNRFVTADQIDAYVVVYSVEDRKSFETAIDRLYEIRQEEGRHIAVILVANKTDLVRTRVVLGEEGKSAAKTYDCKYIEVSAAIDHKIDELLVGILKQIRLLRQRTEKTRSRNRKLDSEDYPKDSCCPLTAKQHVLGKIFHHEKFQSRSCDNLYVL